LFPSTVSVCFRLFLQCSGYFDCLLLPLPFSLGLHLSSHKRFHLHVQVHLAYFKRLVFF
jgi:hypothetical protein